MASSSSSQLQKAGSGPVSRKLFDVFINHRGPDVKETVAAALHKCLKEKNFRAFLDNQEFESGDQIPSTIKNAILSSRVQIAIFSPRYAESAWCLDELVLMLKTKARFIPIFYDVDPSQLRYLDTGAYADAFKNHEEKGRISEERLYQWKKALESSAFILGHRYSTSNDDVQWLCTKIAEAVQKEFEYTRCLEVAKHPVGLDQLVEDFEREVGSRGKIVGITAMGGAGKTTLAKEFFNRKKSEYDGSSFLFDVTEASAKDELPYLQSQLLKDLFKEDTKFRNVDEGTPILRDRMERARRSLLIVLDDVDHRKQLDDLLPINKFFINEDSLVIVTTRDERVLRTAGITIRYKLEAMERANAKQLFCWNAFGVPKVTQGYETLVDSFVALCGGLPLSIQVCAGNLNRVNDLAVWQLELEKFRSTLHLDIKKRLKLSFDRLDREQQQIFMDIACFFIGRRKNIGVRVWNGSGWQAEHTIEILKDKCLIEIEWHPSYASWIDDPWVFRMHGHLRDLGREMADEQRRSIRLWRPQDRNEPMKTEALEHIIAETKNQNIRCFDSVFDPALDCKTTYFIGNSDARRRASSDLLWVEFKDHWDTLESIPSWLPLQRLQCLRVFRGRFRRLWHENGKAPSQLKELQIYGTRFLEFPNQIGMLNELRMFNNLEDLVLETDQSREMAIDGAFLSESLRELTNLARLVLRGWRLHGDLILSSRGCLESKLRIVEIHETLLFSKLLIDGEHCSSLQELVLDKVSFLKEVRLGPVTHCSSLQILVIDILPSLEEVHLGQVKSMKSLKLRDCWILTRVTGNFGQGKLEEMIIHKCPWLAELPELSLLSCLDSIQVEDSFELPVNGNEDLEELEYLHLSNGPYSAIRYISNSKLKSKTLHRTVSNGGIWNRIQRLMSLPSKAITLIGRAVDGAETILNKHLFSSILGSADAVAELPGKGNGNSNLPMMMLHSVSVIIVSLLIQTPSTQDVTIRLGPEHISSRLEPGQWIVTIVLTGQENLNYGRENIEYPFMFVSGCRKKKACTIPLKTGEEGSALSVVQKIVGELYMESTSGS